MRARGIAPLSSPIERAHTLLLADFYVDNRTALVELGIDRWQEGRKR